MKSIVGKTIFLALSLLILSDSSFMHTESVYAREDFSVGSRQECDTDSDCPTGESCVYDSRPAFQMDVCLADQPTDDSVFGDGGDLGSGDELGLPDVSLQSTEGILNILFLLAGSLAVIFIVVGGARFVIAAGNPDQIKQAKNTIVYAVVGLVVAILASVIVNFVISSTV